VCVFVCVYRGREKGERDREREDTLDTRACERVWRLLL